MAIEPSEIPKILFLFFLSGVAIYITAEIIGKVKNEITNVIQ